MRQIRFTFLATSLLMCFCIIATSSCSKPSSTVVAPPSPEVAVSNPIVREITDYFEFPGQTGAVGEVEVRTRVLGYIVKVNFEDGQEVKKGDVLFEIDPRPYQAALDRAKGELARAKAVLEKAKADIARSDRLRPSGAISEDEYEQHAANLAIAKATIQSAEAAERDAALNLEFTRIVSPIDGRVSRAMITEGNLVQPGAMILTKVVTTNPIYVYFNIDEPSLLKYESIKWQSGKDIIPSRIKDQNIAVEIGLDKDNGFPIKGVMDFIDNQVDPKTGTIRARGVFENSKQNLTPGLFVKVRIPFGKAHDALLISERAIGTDQRQKFILTVNKDNVVEYCQVNVGSLQDGMRVITSGVSADDRVIVSGIQRARPGITVLPHPFEKEKVTEKVKVATTPVVSSKDNIDIKAEQSKRN